VRGPPSARTASPRIDGDPVASGRRALAVSAVDPLGARARNFADATIRNVVFAASTEGDDGDGDGRAAPAREAEVDGRAEKQRENAGEGPKRASRSAHVSSVRQFCRIDSRKTVDLEATDRCSPMSRAFRRLRDAGIAGLDEAGRPWRSTC
jgi:hypothetical protein